MRSRNAIQLLSVLLLALLLTGCQSALGFDASTSKGDVSQSTPSPVEPEPDASPDTVPEPPQPEEPPQAEPVGISEEQKRGTWDTANLQPLEGPVPGGEGRAFLADTRGRMGALIVTLTFRKEEKTMRVDVWDPENLDAPIQTITTAEADWEPSNEYIWATDVNFDGHPDIHFHTGGQYLYFLWDEEAGQFARTDQLDGLRAPMFDIERKTVVDEHPHLLYEVLIYQWVDNQLKLMRHIMVLNADFVEGLSDLIRAEIYLPDYDPTDVWSRYYLITVEDWNDYLGKMWEEYVGIIDVTRQEEYIDMWCVDIRWYDLDYHGR